MNAFYGFLAIRNGRTAFAQHFKGGELCTHEGEDGLLLVAEVEDALVLAYQVDDCHLERIEILHLVNLNPRALNRFKECLLLRVVARLCLAYGIVGTEQYLIEIHEVMLAFVGFVLMRK